MKLLMKGVITNNIKKARWVLAFLPLFLFGCATQSPENPEQTMTGSATTKNQKTAVYTAETIKKIPKHLRPEALENRDDSSVVIRAGKTRTYKEYRVGGQLYAIQVIPSIGKPYYLIASDNEGNPIDPTKRTLLVPSWTIFEWH